MEMSSFAKWMFIIVPSDTSQKEAVNPLKKTYTVVKILDEISMLHTWQKNKKTRQVRKLNAKMAKSFFAQTLWQT